MKRSAVHIYALAVCGLLIIPLLIFGGIYSPSSLRNA